MSENLLDEETTAIKDGDFYEISLVPAGSQTGDEGFMVQKIDKSSTQEGDSEMEDKTTEEETGEEANKEELNLEDFSEEDKRKLIDKLKEDLDVETQMKIFLDDEEIEEKLKEEFTEEEEQEKEDEEEEETEKESDMTPKAREAIKTVLSTLSKVKNEVPANYHWVYEALAKLVDDTAPEMGKIKKSAETKITDEVKDAVNESLEEFDKADELSEQENMIKNALEGMVIDKEDEEDTEEISKEAEEQINEYREKLEKVKEEKQELQEEQLKQKLTKKADTLDNIPESKEKVTELYAELYNADESLFEKVENLLKKIDKQSEVGELFKEKGHRSTPDNHKDETADEKLDRLVKEAVEKGNADDEAEAMDKVLSNNPELYGEVKENVTSR